MGRPRNNPDGLPKRVYLKHGGYYYVTKEGKWHRLGEAWNREAKDEYAKVSSDTPSSGTVAALLNAHLGVLHNRSLSGRLSLRHYNDRVVDAARLRVVLGHLPAAAVKRKHIAVYLANRVDKHGKPAPVRANREIALLSAAYRHDVSLDFNPCDGVPRNEEGTRERYVTHWERRTFAKRCCPDWLRAYLLLKYLTGLRMGDMLRLSDENKGARGLVVPIGKSRKRKVLEFRWTWPLRIAVSITRGLSKKTGRDNVDTGSYGDAQLSRWFPVTTAGVKSAWRRGMKKWKDMGNTPFWEHDIRGKTASDDPERAQERLAHSNQRTTDRHYLRGPARIKRVSPLR